MLKSKKRTLSQRAIGFGFGLLSAAALVGFSGCSNTGGIDAGAMPRATVQDHDIKPMTDPGTMKPFYDEIEEIVVIGKRQSKPVTVVPPIAASDKSGAKSDTLEQMNHGSQN